MKKISEIVRNVRDESGLSQNDFARKIGVSSIYISKIETDQKEVSKKFLIKLAEFIDVHPSALAPFLFLNNDIDEYKLSEIERKLINLGENLQLSLIKKKLNNEKIAEH
ncbi:MAG: helix-turn-helix transcriptional regulator [Patescibacteria group bacterium]